jgi:hypothetical protein
MKKVWFFLIAFLFVGTGSPVFGQEYRGGRYNPYNPYLAPEQKAFQEQYPHERNFFSNQYGVLSEETDQRRYLYERDYLTRPYFMEYRKGFRQEDYLFNPYGTIPRRWYDYQVEYSGGGYGTGFETPGMLTSPNPYPRQKESDQYQGPVRERFFFESDYTTVPYGADPRRWYDTQMNYQGTPQKTPEFPQAHPSSPYSTTDVRSQSSGVLTSPFERGVTQGPGTVSTTQELTPPTFKLKDGSNCPDE